MSHFKIGKDGKLEPVEKRPADIAYSDMTPDEKLAALREADPDDEHGYGEMATMQRLAEQQADDDGMPNPEDDVPDEEDDLEYE